VTPDALDLARRMVALPGWRWMPGMLARDPKPGMEYRTCRVLGMGDPLHVDGVMRPTLGKHGFTLEYAMRPGAPPPLPDRPWVPDLDDPATGGALLAALGHEAARVRYSPSLHKQAAGTPWLADLFGSSCNSSITMHASMGRACAAVMIELAGRVA